MFGIGETIEADGVGKLLEYVSLFREYAAMPGDTRKDVWCRIPMSEGFALIISGMYHHPVLNLFGQLKIADGGYIGDEVNRILNERKNKRG